MSDESGPISEDELLYRRIPASSGWYAPATGLRPETFAPHRTADETGLSVYRARFKSIKEAERGRAGKSYYVAVLRAGDLRSHGIRIEPSPIFGDPGHAELPDLNPAVRKQDATINAALTLEGLVRLVEGSYATEDGDPVVRA